MSTIIMKKIKWFLIFVSILFTSLSLLSCSVKKNDIIPTFLIAENITLNSDDAIDWSKYISIKVGDDAVDLKDATISLKTGDSSVSGTCTYEVKYTYQDQDYTQSFEVSFDYPVTLIPIFTIEKNINLTSDKNIDWTKYISIKVGDDAVDLKDATISLKTGDSSVSGTCTYEVKYTYQDQDYTQSFEVSFDYPVTLMPIFTIEKNITLTSDKNIDWSKYISIKVGDDAVDLKDAIISLKTGDSSVSGTCTYEVKYTYQDQDYTQSFEVSFDYPVTLMPIFTIEKNITLTSDKNIDWTKYISIKVGDDAVDLKDATISLKTGDSSVSGTCTYEVKYTYQDQDYTQSFEVSFNYPSVETIRSLTEAEKLAFSSACAQDYSNATMEESFYTTFIMRDKDLFYGEFTEDNEDYYYYVKKVGSEYQFYGDNGWEKIAQEDAILYALEFNFTAISIENVKYDIENKRFVISSEHVSIAQFCPYWESQDVTYIDYEFTIDENNFFSAVYVKNIYQQETYIDQCLFTNIGTTIVEDPSGIVTPPITTETLGDLQKYNNQDSCDVTGIVVAINSKGLLLKDLNVDEYIYVYNNGPVSVQISDVVHVTGTIDTFGGLKQISKPKINSEGSTQDVQFTPSVYTAADINAYTQNLVVGLPATITGTLTISQNKFYNVAVTGTNIIVSICYPTQDLAAYDGQEITFSGYFIYYTSNKYANIILVEETKAPDLEQNQLTEDQKILWNKAVNEDYSNYELTESKSSSTLLKKDDLYYVIGFDEDGYTAYNYYKYINNILNTYTLQGWESTSKVSLFDVQFDLLKNLTKVSFNEKLGCFIVSPNDLNPANLSAGLTGNYSYLGFNIDESTGLFTRITGINRQGGYDIIIQIYNVGATNIIAPEVSCTPISITDIQDVVSYQLCTTEGVIVSTTKNGYLVADPNAMYGHIYVSLNATPTIEIGHKIKIIGVATPCGTSLQFEENNCTIEDLGISNIIPEFEAGYFTADKFNDYVESPFVGYEIEFVATLPANLSPQVSNFNYEIQFIDLKEDLTSFVDQKVLIKGYLMYSDGNEYEEVLYLILKDIELLTPENDVLKALTDEQKALWSTAISANYNNVTVNETLTQTTSYITENEVKVEWYTNVDENIKESYSVTMTNDKYQCNDGSGWQTITEQEYLSYVPVFAFNKINLNQLKYNTRTGLYELSSEDLTIDLFAPFFEDKETTYLGYQFLLTNEGTISAVVFVNIYQNEYYLDSCSLTNFNQTIIPTSN